MGEMVTGPSHPPAAHQLRLLKGLGFFFSDVAQTKTAVIENSFENER